MKKEVAAYIAGFLDGDGSIYVKLTRNNTYRFRFQVAPYIVFYQSQKAGEKFFNKLQKIIRSGYIRKRKDGIIEYIVGDIKGLLLLADTVYPYVRLKKKQVQLLQKILQEKEKVKTAKDFLKLCKKIDEFKKLNYSKKRSIDVREVRKILEKEKLLTP